MVPVRGCFLGDTTLGADMVFRKIVPERDLNMGRQVYLAGPMRGFAEFNFPAFAEGAENLRRKGFKVFSPAEADLHAGFNPKTDTWEGGKEKTIREVMLEDLAWLLTYADMVALLPGWRKSRGAKAEVASATACGIPCYEIGNVLNGNFTMKVMA